MKSHPIENLSINGFASKEEARQWTWDRLQTLRLARFPFPPHGRIPNFAGAEQAARRLLQIPSWRDARAIKVNPDSPQRFVRRQALALGIRVYVPTPRLSGGFHLLDPARIRPADFDDAATLKSMATFSQQVALEEIPQLDAIVTGCAAVARSGKRCGKGAGYSDIEFGILRELGHRAVPVATTVHDVQVVADFPVESNDLPLSWICTPTETIEVADPLPPPEGVEWGRLSEADLKAMVLLQELKALTLRRGQSGR